MAEPKIKRTASPATVQAIQNVELSWFTNKNDNWCAETDLGWCVASGKLDEDQVAQAVEDGDITYTVDEDGRTTFFVGYNTTRRRFVQTVKTFNARQSQAIERHIAAISKIYKELE